MGGSYARTGRVSLLLGCAMLFVTTIGFAHQTAPDNTRVNARDRAKSQPTADQQQNGRTDVSITRDIRRALVSDKTLSTYAHNVKVITQHGQVTLKGPVRTADEKTSVEGKATEIAGAGHVTSQITVTESPHTRSKVKQ